MTHIKSSQDYCPYCKRRTHGVKDFETEEYYCTRCGKFSKLVNVLQPTRSNSPKKLSKDYTQWFNKRVFKPRR